MNQAALDLDGFCCGPLFAPIVKLRAAKRAAYRSGGAEVWAKYRRAKPIWATWSSINIFWSASAAMTAKTGVQHSVDHIVPLQHPLVCGLHCADNLQVTTLAANIRKSNNHWPDMWGHQPELFE